MPKHPFAKKLLSRVELWTVSIRDSFVVLLPITFIGVAATLLRDLATPEMRQLLAQCFGAGWRAATDEVIQVTYGVFGLVLALVLSKELARGLPSRDDSEALPPTWAGIAAMVNFMLCVVTLDGPTIAALGHGSMLLGIVIGIATPELLRPLAALPAMRRLALDSDTDPTFYHSIRLTLPMAMVAFIVMLAVKAASSLPALCTRWLTALPATINHWMDADWLLTSGAVLLNQALWFVSIHGGKVLDQRAQAFFGPVGAGYDPALAWRPLIDTFVHLGGSGATLGLMLALFIVARKGPYGRIAQISLLPSIFNINELLLFGLPIVLNPMFLLPFLLVPLELALLALAAVHSGLVPLHSTVVPWTTPMLLSGYLLTGSWRGAALQAIGLLASTLTYLPFARRAEAQRVRHQAEAFGAATQAIVSEGQRRIPSLQRSSQVDLIARGLLAALTRAIGTPALALAFQPKHDRHGAAVGVEALLRWTHDRHGPVRTDVAVILAEEGGLIRRLGAWVLDEACACKAQWNARGLSRMTMAINVSPLQLGDPQLPALLAGCLKRHRLAPGEIELEITESQAVPMGEVVNDNLTQIVAMGVSLAMDDFGMGHSSLLHMRRFRFHAIKIDGSLTREVLKNTISSDIIRAIAALGHTQNVEVVAEFVETIEQRNALATLGCDLFQGYLHSPPLPSLACIDYLLANGAARDATAAPLTSPTATSV